MFLRLHTIYHAMTNTKATTRDDATNWVFAWREEPWTAQFEVFSYVPAPARGGVYTVYCPLCPWSASIFNHLFGHMTDEHLCTSCMNSFLERPLVPCPCQNLPPPRSCDPCWNSGWLACENDLHHEIRIAYEAVKQDKRFNTD